MIREAQDIVLITASPSTSGSVSQTQAGPFCLQQRTACWWRHGSTYRRWSGSGEQRQDPSTGDDDVINHLRNEVDGVVYKYNVLITVHEVHDWFRRMAAKNRQLKSRREESKTIDSHKQYDTCICIAAVT